MEVSENVNEWRVKPATLSMLGEATADNLVEAAVNGHMERGCTLLHFFGHLEVAKVQQAALSMQLWKQHAATAMYYLRHWQKSMVAQFRDEVRREVIGPAEFTRHSN